MSALARIVAAERIGASSSSPFACSWRVCERRLHDSLIDWSITSYSVSMSNTECFGENESEYLCFMFAGVSHHVSVLDISAVLQKLFHHIHVPLFGCGDQGRPAVLWEKRRAAGHHGNCKVGHCCHGNSGESRQCMECSKGECVHVYVRVCFVFFYMPHTFYREIEQRWPSPTCGAWLMFLTRCCVNVCLPHHPGWHWHLSWWALGQSPNCPALQPALKESAHSGKDIQTHALKTGLLHAMFCISRYHVSC